MSLRPIDRLVVALKLHRVATLVGVLITLAALLTALLSTRSSPQAQGPTVSTVPSLASLFCARAGELATLATTLNGDSWRTAPLGLEESFRSWAADPERERYLPDDVLAFARDECFLEQETVSELQPRTLYEQAVTYVYDTLLPNHLAAPTNAALAALTASPVGTIEQSLTQATTAGSFPAEVSLRVFGRNDTAVYVELKVPSLGPSDGYTLCMKAVAEKLLDTERFTMVPRFGPAPCTIDQPTTTTSTPATTP